MMRKAALEVGSKIKIGIIGAPFYYGQSKVGVKEGPDIIRKTGFVDRLRELGHDVLDMGNVHPPKEIPEIGPAGEKNHNVVLKYSQTLAESVQEIREMDRLCVMLGGDHSVAVGSIAGHYQGIPDKQVVVLMVDAHADMNTGRTSSTGNMHGMVTSYLLHELRNKVNRLAGSDWPEPFLNKEHLVYVGLRDLDVLEDKMLKDLDILHYDIRTIDKLGIPKVLEICFDKLQVGDTRSLHVSFDIDALDPLEAPSTGTPVRGGLSLREGMTIVEAAQTTGRLRGLDLVEVNPTLGTSSDAEITARAARCILLGAIAGERA